MFFKKKFLSELNDTTSFPKSHLQRGLRKAIEYEVKWLFKIKLRHKIKADKHSAFKCLLKLSSKS